MLLAASEDAFLRALAQPRQIEQKTALVAQGFEHCFIVSFQQLGHRQTTCAGPINAPCKIGSSGSALSATVTIQGYSIKTAALQFRLRHR